MTSVACSHARKGLKKKRKGTTGTTKAQAPLAPLAPLAALASPTVRVPVLFAKPSGTRARRARASGVGASEPETLQVQGVKLKELNVIHVIYI